MKAIYSLSLLSMMAVGFCSMGCETSHSESTKTNPITGTQTHKETTVRENPITGDQSVQQSETKTR